MPRDDRHTGWKKPTRRGLALELKKALIFDPDYFEGSLDQFIDLDLNYIDGIISGYQEIWTNEEHSGKLVPWSEILKFSSSILNRPEFWDQSDAESVGNLSANADWVVSSIVDLIKAGTASDDNAFEPELLADARSILEMILLNQPGERVDINQDAVSTSINSPRGRSIEALINLALRYCRIADKSDNKNHEEIWKSEFEALFNNLKEDVNKDSFEFVTLFTNNLPQFLYMNRQWSLEQLPWAFDRSNLLKWRCAVQG